MNLGPTNILAGKLQASGIFIEFVPVFVPSAALVIPIYRNDVVFEPNDIPHLLLLSIFIKLFLLFQFQKFKT